MQVKLCKRFTKFYRFERWKRESLCLGRTRKVFTEEPISRLSVKGTDRILIRGKRRKGRLGGGISICKGTEAGQCGHLGK